jgi:hypothetical protein
VKIIIGRDGDSRKKGRRRRRGGRRREKLE